MLVDQIAPASRENITEYMGFSYLDDVKYQNKSGFLKDFYKGNKKPNY